jgi:hypothetical protein
MVIEGEMQANNSYGAVRVDGVPLDPTRAREVDGCPPSVDFSWGYVGTGSRLLALGILLAAGLSDSEARKWAVAFKDVFIATLKHDAPFRFEVDVLAWIATRWAATNPRDTL